MPRIQKADRRARQKAILMVLVGVIVGSAIMMTLQLNRGKIDAWLLENRRHLIDHPELIALFFLVLMLPVLASAVYLWRFAVRTVDARQFPPPGTQVVRDTVVLSGRAAVMRGHLLQFVAGLLASAAFLLPAMIWYILRSIANTT
jgi:uncharacterized membrane protein